MNVARVAAVAAVVVLSACSGASTPAGELPGPVPQGVEFREPPATAPPAPPVELTLLDGSTVEVADEWNERPVVLVFFESWCTLCRDQQSGINDVVADYRDVVLFVGIANLSEVSDVEQYVADNDITYPVGIEPTGRTFLNYAVTEPPLVALVSKGGRVLRGWPEGITGEELREHIDELAVDSS